MLRGRLPGIMVSLTSLILISAVTAVALLLGHAWSSDGPGAAPACSWPLRVDGHATAAQTGLIRCYLKAVAQHDLGALKGVANPRYRLTSAQLVQAGDARSGLATASVTMSPEDTGVGTVRIDYADGATGSFGIEIVNPQVAGSWRFDIGGAPQLSGPVPSPASTSSG